MAQLDFLRSTPATPAAGYAALGFPTTGNPVWVDEAGITHSMGGLTGWYDVTSYGVLPGNAATLNTTNLNSLLGSAPAGSTIYFPGGTYQFNGAITAGKAFTYKGQGSNLSGGYTILQIASNLAGNFLTITDGFWYSQFENIVFSCSVTQSAGAAVKTGNNVAVNFKDCSFQGGSSSATLFNCIDYTGANGANSSIVDNCSFYVFTGSGIIVNGGGSSLVVSNTIMNGIWGSAASNQFAAAGISCRVVGALQVIGCDIIGCTNNLLLAPQAAEVCASVHCTNTYFDNSLGSCVKITGAGATVRCKFESCTMTVTGPNFGSLGGTPTGLTAVELSSTFAYAANGQAIDFYNCNIFNTGGNTGTTFGFKITGMAEFGLWGCRVAAWTNGIDVTPIATANRTRFSVQGCRIGNTGDYAGNATGINLQAGSAQYGNILINDNDLSGNTTAPLTDASTQMIGFQKSVQGNVGLITGSCSLVSDYTVTVTDTLIPGCLLSSPALCLRVGSTVRFRIEGLATATGNITGKLHFGTSGTASDTGIVNGGAVAGVANQSFVIEGSAKVSAIGGSGTMRGQAISVSGNTAQTGSNQAAATGINMNVANWFSLSIAQAATTGAVVTDAWIDVVQQ